MFLDKTQYKLICITILRLKTDQTYFPLNAFLKKKQKKNKTGLFTFMVYFFVIDLELTGWFGSNRDHHFDLPVIVLLNPSKV